MGLQVISAGEIAEMKGGAEEVFAVRRESTRRGVYR